MSTSTDAPPTTLSRELLTAADPERDLARVVLEIAVAAKLLERDIGGAALSGRLGLAGTANISGEGQKKLDVHANDTMLAALEATRLVAAVVSEENDDLVELAADADAPFVVAIDPLDGSSNTDVNGSVGTIFAIRRRGSGPLADDLLRPGREQLAAGYVMYGTSTLLVTTLGGRVRGYTLDRSIGEFVLSHPDLRCPSHGAYYSANLANLLEWDAGPRAFVDHALTSETADGKPYSLRYSGALVADVHRTLIDGGIYFYPADADHPDGKLRLLYECAPLAQIVEAAGGAASTGRLPIRDVAAERLHQRVPLAIGSVDDVERYVRLGREGPAGG